MDPLIQTHETLTTSQLRKDIARAVGRASFGRERLVILRNNKPAVAMISVEDLELFERLEDAYDVLMATQALDDARAKGEAPVRWADVKARLGL
jgi:PHD/YefM family antitoxin component YafN of YafNO toxin-antitoxin module